MARRPIPIEIKSSDLNQIEQLLRAGFQQVRVIFRALALRHLAKGATAPRVAEALPITGKAIRQIALLNAEIARLRRIEEAARALMTPHTLTTTNPPKGEPTAGWEWPEWDALRAALEENR